jgi:DNA-binding NarL/FixJ family response regulator
VRIVVQHRQRFFREGLALLLRREPDVDELGTAVGSTDIAAVCASTAPDVVLLEIDSDEWDPCRVAAALRRTHRRVHFVGLHAADRGPEAVRAGYAGIRAVVHQKDGIEPILAAVRAVPHRPFAPIVVPNATQLPGALTRREIDVLSLVSAGWTSREISERLSISYKTVENHKQRIFEKLGVQNQAHAVAVAMRRGVISAESANEQVS